MFGEREDKDGAGNPPDVFRKRSSFEMLRRRDASIPTLCV